MTKPIKFNVSPLQRAMLLACITIICYITASFLALIVLGKGMTATRMAIITILQDIFLFIVPSIVTAILITRRPAEFLAIDKGPSRRCLQLGILALLASIPAMNMIIEWNASVTIPAWFGSCGQWIIDSEKSASEAIKVMVNGESVMSLIMLILVVGIFAGMSEELFFRGTIQRMMTTSGFSPHIAIWTTAIIFSAVHLQFFGFVPRLLLGAMFGYMAWWSGSVWLSVTAHCLNNSLAATVMWIASRNPESGVAEIETIGAGNLLTAGASAVISIGLLYALKVFATKRPSIARQSNQ